MDKNAIIQIVMGAVMSIVLGCMGWVFQKLQDLEHEQVLHVTQANNRLDQAESERKDIWGHYNDELVQKFNFMKAYGQDKLDQAENNKQMSEQQLQFEINYWKERAQ